MFNRAGRCKVIFVMIAALVLAGCQVDTMPQDVEHFTTSRAANKDQAAYNGTYALYGDDSDQTSGPLLMTKHLLHDQVYGFEIGGDHLPYAIAGNDRLLLQPGRYRWQLTPDAGQVDWNKTNTIVVEVVLATGAVALIVVGAILVVK